MIDRDMSEVVGLAREILRDPRTQVTVSDHAAARKFAPVILDYAEMLSTLTSTQARCTELLLENRRLQAENDALRSPDG